MSGYANRGATECGFRITERTRCDATCRPSWQCPPSKAASAVSLTQTVGLPALPPSLAILLCRLVARLGARSDAVVGSSRSPVAGHGSRAASSVGGVGDSARSHGRTRNAPVPTVQPRSHARSVGLTQFRPSATLDFDSSLKNEELRRHRRTLGRPDWASGAMAPAAPELSWRRRRLERRGGVRIALLDETTVQPGSNLLDRISVRGLRRGVGIEVQRAGRRFRGASRRRQRGEAVGWVRGTWFAVFSP